MSNQDLVYNLVLETKSAVGDIKQMLAGTGKNAGVAGDKAGKQFGNLFNKAALTYVSARLFESVKDLTLTAFGSFSLLDDKLADVRKTVGLTEDEASAFRQEIFKIGRTSRTSIDDLLGIATIGGQFGRAKDEIVEFTKNVDVLAVALGDEFPGGVEEATTAVSKIGNVFKEFKGETGRPTTKSILNIGNALNLLSADGAATSPVIADFATRIGAVSEVVGLSAGQVLGFSAALQELAVEPERGSSAVTRILQLIAKSPDEFAKVLGISSKEFRKIVDTDINQAFMMVAGSVAGSDLTATQFADTLDKMGLSGVYNTEIVAKLGANTELLAHRQGQATEALGGTTSLLDEYEIKNNNAAAASEKFNNKVTEVQSAVGNALAPVLIEAMEAITPLVDKIVKWTEENPELLVTILAVTAGVAGLLAVIAGIMTVWGIVAPVLAMVGTAFGAVGAAIGGTAGAMSTLGAIFTVLTGPIGLIIASIALLTAGIVWAYNNVGWFRDLVDSSLQKITDWFAWAKDNWVEALGQVIGFLVSMLNPIKWVLMFSGAIVAVVDYLRNVDWGAVWERVKTAFVNTWEGIKTWFTNIDWGQFFKDGANGLMDFISGLIRGFASGIPGADAVINPLLDKIPRFATGGEFLVGGNPGIDTNLVQFMATKGERVIVQTPNQQKNQNINSNNNSNITNIIYTSGNSIIPQFMNSF